MTPPHTPTGEPPVGTDPTSAPRLRILIVSDYYAPFIGGAERQTRLLAHELAARGHHTEVATVWSPGLPRLEDDDGVMVHRVRQLRTSIPRRAATSKHHATPFPDPVMAASLRQIIDHVHPDVIHSYGWISYSCAAALTGRPTPMVVSARDYAYGCATRTLVYRGAPCSGPELRKCLGCASDYFGRAQGWVAVVGGDASWRLLRRKASGVHSVSRYVHDMVERDFVDDRIAGIPHEVIPSFTEAMPPLEAPEDPALTPYLRQLPDEPYILFVGELRTEKGLDVLLGAYRAQTDPPPLVMIGPRTSDTPSQLPPGVHMLHDFPHPAVIAAWRHALFGVTPSLWPEPLGSVVYEGMSLGRAMIGTVPGGHADMITDGVSGRLVPAGDLDALTQAMRQLLEDPATRERFGTAARAQAATFVAAVAVPRFEALYRDAIRYAHR